MAFDISLRNPGAGSFDIELADAAAGGAMLVTRRMGRHRIRATGTVTVSGGADSYNAVDVDNGVWVDESGNPVVWM